MNHRLASFIAFMWLFGTLFSLLVEGSFISADESEVLNKLVIFNQIEQTGEGGIFELAKMLPGFISALPNMLIWNYSYLDGPMSFIRYILMIFSFGFVAILLALFLNAVQGLFSAVRGVLGF